MHLLASRVGTNFDCFVRVSGNTPSRRVEPKGDDGYAGARSHRPRYVAQDTEEVAHDVCYVRITIHSLIHTYIEPRAPLCPGWTTGARRGSPAARPCRFFTPGHGEDSLLLKWQHVVVVVVVLPNDLRCLIFLLSGRLVKTVKSRFFPPLISNTTDKS